MAQERRGVLARVIISVVVVVVALGLGLVVLRGLAALKKPPEQGLEPPPLVRVRTLVVERRDFREEIRGYGRVRALREVVIASELQGIVAEVSPRLEGGAAFAADELMVRIEDFDHRRAAERIEAQKEQLERDIAVKEATVKSLVEQLEVANREFDLARAEAGRTAELNDRGTASSSDLDQKRITAAAAERLVVKLRNDLELARLQVDWARSGLEALVADLALARKNVERCTIRAPFAGVVLGREIALGARVSPGQELARLVDPGRVEVAVSLPAAQKDAVAVGRPLRLESRDGSLRIETRIDRVAPVIDEGERTFLVYAELGNDEVAGPLPAPGAFLRAVIEGPLVADVQVIPRTAILGDEVFVVERAAGQDGVAVVRAKALVADRVLPDHLLARDPALDGREIVRDNLEQIASGSRVAIVGDAPAAENAR